MKAVVTSKRFWFMMVLAVSLLAGGSALQAGDDTAALFEAANTDYREGRYDEAAEKYATLAERDPRNAVYYFNLGNSQFRRGVIGQAIWAFESARTLEPRDRDIQDNLEYVRGMLEYKVDDKRNWYVRMAIRVLETVTEREVSLVLLAIFFLFAGGWCFNLYFRRGEPWRWRRKTLMAIFCIVAVVFAGKKVETDFFRDAIVISREAEVRYGPSSSDQVAFRLGEGLKVFVIDGREKWSRIILTNHESGWVRNNQIAKVVS